MPHPTNTPIWSKHVYPLTGLLFFEQLEHDVEEARLCLRVYLLQAVLLLLTVFFHIRR